MIRAYFIEVRGSKIRHKQTGYMEAILSLSRVSRNLEKREENIYAASVEFTLSVFSGTLSHSQISGLTIGDEGGDSRMVFTGTLANINVALTGLSFASDEGFLGDARLSLSIFPAREIAVQGVQAQLARTLPYQ